MTPSKARTGVVHVSFVVKGVKDAYCCINKLEFSLGFSAPATGSKCCFVVGKYLAGEFVVSAPSLAWTDLDFQRMPRTKNYPDQNYQMKKPISLTLVISNPHSIIDIHRVEKNWVGTIPGKAEGDSVCPSRHGHIIRVQKHDTLVTPAGHDLIRARSDAPEPVVPSLRFRLSSKCSTYLRINLSASAVMPSA